LNANQHNILTAEVIRQQLLANITKFDLKKVNHDPVKSFVYYYNLLNTGHVLRWLFAEYYPHQAQHDPNFLAKLAGSPALYLRCLLKSKMACATCGTVSG
jgi:hypothetical protein